MSGTKATQILPTELIELIQEFIDGETIYIPKKPSNIKQWGSNTSARQDLEYRNKQIYQDYLLGNSMNDLACGYYLSLKSIQRIVLQAKKTDKTSTSFQKNV